MLWCMLWWNTGAERLSYVSSVSNISPFCDQVPEHNVLRVAKPTTYTADVCVHGSHSNDV